MQPVAQPLPSFDWFTNLKVDGKLAFAATSVYRDALASMTTSVANAFTSQKRDLAGVVLLVALSPRASCS